MSQFPLFYNDKWDKTKLQHLLENQSTHRNKDLELEKWKNCSKDLTKIPEI